MECLRNYILLFSLILLLFPKIAVGQNIVSGTVFNKNKQPLVGVNVSISQKNIGTATNNSGYYKLKINGLKNAQLIFQFIGYKTEKRNIQFNNKNSLVINVTMIPEAISMEGIEITEDKYEPTIGVYKIKPGEIRTIPGFYSDAISAVKTLPGVASNNEMSNTFHVHGGNGNDNLILLEDFRIPQPRQIRNSYQEGMSLVNPALIQNFQLLSGSFPAQYGGKMHSVLLTEYRQSSDKKIHGEIELSLVNAGFMIEGNFKKSGYWAVASRWTDTGAILNTLQTEGYYRPKFFDFQAISRIPLSKNHKLNLFGFFLRNDFQLKPENYRANYGAEGFSIFYNEFRTEFEGKEQSLFQTKLFASSLESQLTSSIKMKNSFVISKNNENDKVDLAGDTFQRTNVEYGTDEAEHIIYLSSQKEYRNNELHEQSMTYKNKISLTLPKHVFQFGADINRSSFKDNLEEKFHIFVKANQDTIKSREESYDFATSANLKHNSYSFWTDNSFQITQDLSLNYGIRTHYFSYNEDWTIDPRMNIKWKYYPQTWFAFSWGKYSQPPEYRELRDRNHNLVSDLKSQEAQQIVASFYHKNHNNTETRIEAFFINQKRLIPYDFTDIFIQYQPEYHATGKTYGINFFWYGKFNDRLNSWLSYNYLVARQTISEMGNREFPSPTDQRQTISIVLQDDIPSIPTMRAHMRLLFGSGYPYTAQTAAKNEETGVYYPVDYRRLGFRMAYYRRLDIGMSYSNNFLNKYNTKIMVEIFNVFDFKNVLSYKYYILQDGGWQWVRNNLSRRIYNLRINFNF